MKNFIGFSPLMTDVAKIDEEYKDVRFIRIIVYRTNSLD